MYKTKRQTSNVKRQTSNIKLVLVHEMYYVIRTSTTCRACTMRTYTHCTAKRYTSSALANTSGMLDTRNGPRLCRAGVRCASERDALRSDSDSGVHKCSCKVVSGMQERGADFTNGLDARKKARILRCSHLGITRMMASSSRISIV